MPDSALPLFIVFEVTALIFVALGVPLRLRKVRPNWLYGFRTPSTVGNPELWYEVNARTGTDLIGTGIVLALLVPIMSAVCRSIGTVTLVCTGWLLAGTLFMTLHGALFIREYKRQTTR